MSKVTIDLDLCDLVQVDLLLHALASDAENEARTLDGLDLPVCAAHARIRATQARRLAAAIVKATDTTLRPCRVMVAA